MDENSRLPFPQANDFEKVVQIVSVPNKDIVKNDDDLGIHLDGITARQARYYIAAAKYLGILDDLKNFTETGERLRQMNSYKQKVELIRLVLSDRVFGTVYFTERLLGMTLSREDIAEIIEEEYPEYCPAIFKRRAQTVRSWLSWITSQFSE